MESVCAVRKGECGRVCVRVDLRNADLINSFSFNYAARKYERMNALSHIFFFVKGKIIINFRRVVSFITLAVME